MSNRLETRVASMITRATILRVDESTDVTTVQVELHDGEIESDVELLTQEGAHHVPAVGSECIVLAVGGSASHRIAIVPHSATNRPKGAAANTAGLYTLGAWRIFIDANGIVHIGAEEGVAALARADRVDAVITQLLDALTDESIIPAPPAGADAGEPGLTALLAAIAALKLIWVSTAADKVKGV